MSRYHVNPETGDPGLCSAKEGNCPFKALHFETAQGARDFFEAQNDGRIFTVVGSSKPPVQEAPIFGDEGWPSVADYWNAPHVQDRFETVGDADWYLESQLNELLHYTDDELLPLTEELVKPKVVAALPQSKTMKYWPSPLGEGMTLQHVIRTQAFSDRAPGDEPTEGEIEVVAKRISIFIESKMEVNLGGDWKVPTDERPVVRMFEGYRRNLVSDKQMEVQYLMACDEALEQELYGEPPERFVTQFESNGLSAAFLARNWTGAKTKEDLTAVTTKIQSQAKVILEANFPGSWTVPDHGAPYADFHDAMESEMFDSRFQEMESFETFYKHNVLTPIGRAILKEAA